jgi:predicted nucleic acid-binding protein
MALILDTGPLLAALDAADGDHEACAELVISSREDLVVPMLVLSELVAFQRRAPRAHRGADAAALLATRTSLDDVHSASTRFVTGGNGTSRSSTRRWLAARPTECARGRAGRLGLGHGALNATPEAAARSFRGNWWRRGRDHRGRAGVWRPLGFCGMAAVQSWWACGPESWART